MTWPSSALHYRKNRQRDPVLSQPCKVTSGKRTSKSSGKECLSIFKVKQIIQIISHSLGIFPKLNINREATKNTTWHTRAKGLLVKKNLSSMCPLTLNIDRAAFKEEFSLCDWTKCITDLLHLKWPPMVLNNEELSHRSSYSSLSESQLNYKRDLAASSFGPAGALSWLTEGICLEKLEVGK